MFHKFKHNISSDLKIDQQLLEQLHNSLVQDGFLKRLRTLPHVWILTSKGRERIQDNYQKELSKETEESIKILETNTIQALEAYYEERKSEDKRRNFFNKQLMLYEFENLRHSLHKYAEFEDNQLCLVTIFWVRFFSCFPTDK
ncbi:MAG: hypothetical protein ACFFDT_33745 [Candidatus Hodarchaeota archaeon]